MAPYTERDLAEVTRGDDTTDSGLVEEKGPIHNDECEDGKSESPRSARQSSLDLEAQEDNISVNRVETQDTIETRHTHRSVLSRLSRKRSKPKNALAEIPILALTDLDAGVVGWESQDDPEMPLNFTSFRKWSAVLLLSIITFMTPFASSILAPAITFVAEDYGIEDLTIASMPVSIFLLGYAVGPLVLSPLSEIYGRNGILTVASAWFCVWMIACALAPDIGSLVFFRFMCGVGGSASITIGGAIIADMFPISQRGAAITLWMMGPVLGPTVAPVIGGYVAESIGWRWTAWLTVIPATIVLGMMVLLNRETSHHVLIKRKTDKLRKELNRPELRSCYVGPNAPVVTRGQLLTAGLIRPLKMLFRSAIVFSVSLYIAFAYGCLYLLFNTIPFVFQSSYGWSIGNTGLVYLSLLVGYAAGLASFSFMSDKTVVRMTEANGGVYEPEFRLPNVMYFAPMLPITFFWYGWTADKAVHWIVPIIGIVPFGFSIVGVWMPIQAYLVDAFPQYAASALAAFAVLRSTVAAFLPLAGPKMYDSLGVGWGTSLLGFIAIALIPIPTLIYKYGKWMREKYPVSF
ncbi:major facilitator superfamily protein [Sarocladium implicatum]|nr:major facilitator superfamily protein [Sarocladium implicatum]